VVKQVEKRETEEEPDQEVIMMSWEINYAENFVAFLNSAGISENDLLKIKSRMDYVSQSPITLSEHVQGLSLSNLRRVRFGDFRIFILIDPIGQVINCLAFLPRKSCYDQKSLNRVATIVRDFMRSHS
jgi:mRNA-degrading endonuclease RelE of RelBE toxin-antitoxin system